MIKIQNNKRIYTLEERTYQFAKSVRIFCKELSKSLLNSDDIKQLIRSSGSIGANYVEANESLSKKDFLMRVKISRKKQRKVFIGSD
jgi:four helix bundle protein